MDTEVGTVLQTCRTCLEQITTKSSIPCSNNTDLTGKLTIWKKLISCIPELDENLICNAVICVACFTALNSAYNFRSKCLETEFKIHNYAQQINCGFNDINLVEVEQVNKPYNVNVMEIKWEAHENTLEDFKSEESTSAFSLNGNEQDFSNMNGTCLQDQNIADAVSLKLKHNTKSHINEDTFIQCVQSQSQLKCQPSLIVHKKAYKCSYCEYESTRKNDFTVHLRIHTGEKPFKCSQCDFQCNRKSNLKRHMITHTGDNSFSCNICEHKAVTRRKLMLHVRTHTRGNPFQCPHCKYRSNQYNNLKCHVRTHTEEKTISMQSV